MKPKDKYDLAVEYLTEHPGEIYGAWYFPYNSKGGCLFQFVRKHRNSNDSCGCLVGIRRGSWNAETEELTAAIRADKRIPESMTHITPAHLPIFAEWQRRIDKELGRE